MGNIKFSGRAATGRRGGAGWLIRVLLAVAGSGWLAGHAAGAVTEPAPQAWKARTVRAVFVGTVKDYRGCRAAFFLDAQTGATWGPLDLPQPHAGLAVPRIGAAPRGRPGLIGELTFCAASAGGAAGAADAAGDTAAGDVSSAGHTVAAGVALATGNTISAGAAVVADTLTADTKIAAACDTLAAGAGDPEAAGTFLAFAPSREHVRWDDLVPKIQDPIVLGILAGCRETQAACYRRLQEMNDPEQRTRGAIGLLLGRAGGLVRDYIQNGSGPMVPGDFRLLALLLSGSLQDLVLAVSGADASSAGTPLAALLPAIRAWLQKDVLGAEAAVYQALLSAPLPGFTGQPAAGAPGPFAAGHYAQYGDYAEILHFRAPDFYALVATALRGASSELDAYALDLRPLPGAGESRLVFVSGERRAVGEALFLSAAELPAPVFGTPLRLVLKSWPAGPARKLRRLRVLAWLPGRTDEASVRKTVRLLEEVPLAGGTDDFGRGPANAYLAQAAREHWAGYSWAAWHRAMRQDQSEKWLLWAEEVMRVNPDPDTARQMEVYLQAVAGRKSYVALGSAGFAVANVYLRRQDWDEAQRWLEELPRILRQAGETYDGHGGIGTANRLALASLRYMASRLAGHAGTWPEGVDRREAAAYLLEFVRDWDDEARKPWLRVMQQAGLPL